MERFSGFVKRTVRALNRSRVKYMLTGAVASSYYGRPRSTHDIDVIINCKQKDLPKLANELTKAGLDVSPTTLWRSWKSNYAILTINDNYGPHVLDLIFTEEKLLRRTGRIVDLPTFYESAESLILAKLRMLKVTIDPEKSAVDRGDISAVLRTTRLNLKSLSKRARMQGTYGILEGIMRSLLKAKQSRKPST